MTIVIMPLPSGRLRTRSGPGDDRSSACCERHRSAASAPGGTVRAQETPAGMHRSEGVERDRMAENEPGHDRDGPAGPTAERRRHRRPDAVPGREHHPARTHPGRAQGPRAGAAPRAGGAGPSADAEEQRSRTKRKRILIGAGVTVGVVALIAVGYAVAQPDEEVQAQCVDEDDVIVDDANCVTPATGSSSTYYGGGGGFYPIFIGAGGRQYHYNYGGTGTVGDRVSGGTTTVPRDGTRVRTTSGRTATVSTSSGSSASSSGSSSVSRGGLGSSSSSGSSKSARRAARRAAAERAPGAGEPRPDWEQTVREQGMVFGTPGRGEGGAPAAVLGRVGALRVRDGRDPLPGGRRRGRALDVPAGGGPRGHHRAVPRLRAARVVLGGRRGVLAAQRPARLRPVRPALRRRRPGQAAGVQRRHPDHAARGVDPAVELAQGHPPRRRPVELAAREAGRALGRAEGPAARRRRVLHLVGAATPPARTTSPSATCRRPRPRPG